MSSFKKLSKSDVSVVPYYANKQWNLSIDCFPTSSDYLTIYKGTNLTSSFSFANDPKSEGEYERLIYAQINQLFYQEYTSPLNTASLANSIYYESASQQRPTSSYFIYNDNDKFINQFPTGANSTIRVIAINQDIYGNKVLPNTLVLSSSAYYVVDDGCGNLADIKVALGGYISSSYIDENYFFDIDPTLTTFVGNVFYAHGLVVITNPDYQLMFPTASCGPTTSTTTTTTTLPDTTTTTTTTTSTTTTTTTTAPPPTTTTSTTTTTTTVAGFNVYMSICAQASASNPEGVVNFTIYANTGSGIFNSTNGEFIDTDVTMSVTITGNVHTFTSSSVVMGTSTRTVGNFFTGFDADEPILSISINSISPANFGSEIYVIGDTQTVTGNCAV